MILILVLGVSLIALAVALVIRATSDNVVEERRPLRQISAYGFNIPRASSSVDSRERLNRIADVMGEIYGRHAGTDREREVLEMLRSAGLYRMRAVTFVGYRVLATVVTSLFLLWFMSAAGATPIVVFLFILIFGAIAWLAPVWLVKRRAAQRLEAIDREVPELVDLLVTTVEAGVGFTAALQLTARRVQGPLGEELRVALSEQGMGLTINESLGNMLTRANTPALRMFVQAIIQGETLGVSIGKILRDLAIDMRKRRRLAAEERAQKAPTKIIFPLVLLILPALFIVCVGPIIMNFVHGLQ